MRRTWIKLYVDQCLRGSMIEELTPGQRWMFIGLLLMAGDSEIAGCVYRRKNENGEAIGYNELVLADALGVRQDELAEALVKMQQKAKITVDELGVISIVNWHKYQSEYERTRSAASRRTKVQPSGVEKYGLDGDRDGDGEGEGEREREEEVKIQTVSGESSSTEDLRLVQLLIDLMQKNNPNSSILKRLTPLRQVEWVKACRLLREVDGKKPEEIERVIAFSQQDDFWKSNILSMPKLRDKWDQLWLKARRGDPMSGIRSWLEKKRGEDDDK